MITAFKMLLLYLLFLHPLHKYQWSLSDRTQVCSRPQSAIVRQLVQKLWRPVFKRFNQKMPSQCPLHFGRDFFGPQELAKDEFRSDLWMCKICGKPFHSHSHLDLHLAQNHQQSLFKADESVCLADFCDIFRCHGYLPRNFTTQEKDGLDKINSMGDYEAIYPDLKVPKPEVGSTELILGPPETLLKLMKLQEKETRSDIEGDRDYFESLQEFLPYLSKVQTRLRSSLHTAITSDFQGSSSNHEKIRRRDTIPRSSKAKNALDSMFVSHQERSHEGNPAPHPDLMEENEEERILEIWQLPEDPADAYCDEAEMNGLQKKCESLIFQCISPLSLSMDDEKFKAFQEKLHRKTCYYLSCDQYWNFLDVNGKWGFHRYPYFLGHRLTFGLFSLLLIAFGLCLAATYYLVWFCF